MKLNKIKHNGLASVLLDFFRFIAAFWVMVHHTSLVVPVPYDNHSTNIFIKFLGWAFYELCQTGYPFVMVFFVLSGFFISSSVLSMVKEGKWSWKFYLVNRIIRLWIVLIPALILSIIWKIAQFHYFGTNISYPDDMLIGTFLGNLFFFQNIFTPVYAHNGPLWSLNYEFWYYMIFPCIVLAITSKNIFTKSAYIIGILAISLIVGESIIKYFLIWLLGLVPVLFRFKLNKKLMYWLFSISIPLFILSLRLLYLKPINIFYADLSVGLMSMLIIYFTMNLFNDLSPKPKLAQIGTFLSGFAYTLYLVHYPILDFVTAWFHSGKWYLPVTSWQSVDSILVIFILIYSLLISRLTENYTSKVRRLTLKLINKLSYNIIIGFKKAPTK